MQYKIFTVKSEKITILKSFNFFTLWKRSFKSADPKLLTEDDMKKYVAKGTKYVSISVP